MIVDILYSHCTESELIWYMEMKASKDAWTADEFRKFDESMSKYFDLRGCETEKCINNRIRSKNSKKLNVLVEHGFAFRLLLESWPHPHLVYKKILGMDDETYNWYLEEKRKVDKIMRAIGDGWKSDRKFKRRFPVFYDARAQSMTRLQLSYMINLEIVDLSLLPINRKGN